MPQIQFTQNLSRHVDCMDREVHGVGTVKEALEAYFAESPAVRSYVLDDAGAVRPHIVIFHCGKPIADPTHQSDPVNEGSDILVMQALSGG